MTKTIQMIACLVATVMVSNLIIAAGTLTGVGSTELTSLTLIEQFVAVVIPMHM